MLTKFLEKYFPDSIVTKVWSNKRLRALILLPIWIVFIILIYSLGIKPYKNNIDNKEPILEEPQEELTLYDYENNLLNSNYSFEYTINDDTKYYGTYKNGIIEGYKETIEEIKKFKIIENKVYIVNLDNYVLDENIDITNYEGYLSIDYLFNFLHNKTYVCQDNDFIFDLSDLYVKISLDNDNISTINIIDGEMSYTLSFSIIS